MLKEMHGLNIPLRYIELGNEYYYSHPEYIDIYPTPKKYAQDMNTWIDSIKNLFPDVKVGVVGSQIPESNRQFFWNQIVLNNLDYTDAITYHQFPKTGLSVGIDKDDVYLPEVLSVPYRVWTQAQETVLNEISDDLDIWVTEYSMYEYPDSLGIINTTWTHALFTALTTLLFLEDVQIKLLLKHALITSLSFSALYDENINYTLTPSGYATKLLINEFRYADYGQKLEFSPNPLLIRHQQIAYPAMYGWLFHNSKYYRDKIVFLNMSPLEQKISLSQLYEMEQDVMVKRHYVQDPLEKNIQNEDIITTGLWTWRDGAIDIPAYSITIIDGQLKTDAISTNHGKSQMQITEISPNPTGGNTIIRVNLTNPVSDLQLMLIDLKGSPIDQLSLGAKLPGDHTILLNDSIFNNSNGIYYLIIQSKESMDAKKLIIINENQ